jgi:putative ABC transport system permease protein
VAGYLADARSANAIESLLLTGLVAAGLLLVLACSGRVASAHEAELALVRARGGATSQVAARMLVRAAVISVPAVAAGTLLALAVTPAGETGAARFGGLTIAVTLAAPPLVAAWTHRRARAQPGRADLTAARRTPRRAVAEVTFLVVAAGSLAALRQRGVAGGADGYTNASPVLAAGVAALLVARVYPLAVRPLAAASSAGRGPVGFIGLARAARSRLGEMVPALVLVLSLTLAAFGAMISHSIGAAQVAAAWRQVGADAAIQAPGNSTISAAASRRIGAVSGVRAVAPVLAAGPLAYQSALSDARAGPRPISLVMVNPASYAAVAAGTPWPAFPAAALGGRLGPASRPVPALISTALGPARDGAVLRLTVGGIVQPIRVAGTIGATPASPGGGTFVLLPSWAVSRFPALAWPQTLLVRGPAAAAPALRAAAARQVPGGQLRVRARVQRRLADSPVQHAAARLYLSGSVVAVLFGAVAVALALAASARRRRQLITRLSALGMASRQSAALALTEIVPLLLVGVAGMALAGYALAAVTGPALNLTVFTGSLQPVPVRAWPPGMLAPAAVVVVVAALIVTAENVLSARRALAAELRQQEAG